MMWQDTSVSEELAASVFRVKTEVTRTVKISNLATVW
jgi:hypothetical protein